MCEKVPSYRKLDLNTWPRREHYTYYKNVLPCGYSMTARLDVTEVLRYARARRLKFFGCFLYAASRTVNEMDAMRMMTDPEGNPGVWERVHPNFTIFHKDDESFSDLWTEYQPSFSAFYREYRRVVEEYGAVHGMKARPGQPANFFCISCVPWMDYTGYSTYLDRAPALFPILTFGKYTESEGRDTLPLTVAIAHAAADGYHTSCFFRKLQEHLDHFSELAEL